MSSYKSFDALFSAILTAYQNAGLASSITVGDELYVRGAGLASVVWGAYRECDWVANQIWPDTASQDGLLHWGSIKGITKNDGETWAAYLARVIKRFQAPASGGNKIDFEVWGMEATYGTQVASSATCYGGVDAYGPGTVVLVIEAADGPPSVELLSAIRDYCLAKVSAEFTELYVIAPTTTPINITLTMAGGDNVLAANLIKAFMASLSTGQPVYPEVFSAFCYQAGATAVTLESPQVMVSPDKFGKVVISSLVVARK